MKKTIKLFVIAGLTIAGVNSCDTLESLCDINEDDLATGELFVTSLNHVIDVYERVDNVRKDSMLNATGANTIDGANCVLTNDSLIIDFGSVAVENQDGKYRSGSIRAKVTGDYTKTGGSIDATMQDFIVNNDQIMGKLYVGNQDSEPNPLMVLNTTNFEVNNETIVNYSLQMQWLNGFESEDLTDDTMELSGTVTGGDSINSKEFTAEILSPLKMNGACNVILESGEVRLLYPNDEFVPSFDIDFIESDGCNNLFRATVDCQGSPLSFTFPLNN